MITTRLEKRKASRPTATISPQQRRRLLTAFVKMLPMLSEWLFCSIFSAASAAWMHRWAFFRNPSSSAHSETHCRRSVIEFCRPVSCKNGSFLLSGRYGESNYKISKKNSEKISHIVCTTLLESSFKLDLGVLFPTNIATVVISQQDPIDVAIEGAISQKSQLQKL